MRNHLTLLAYITIPITLVSACGTTQVNDPSTKNQSISFSQSKVNSNQSTHSSIGTNQPFEIRTKQEVVPLDPNFDPFTTQFSTMNVVSWKGKSEILHISKEPVLLVAYWCPHCQRTLKLLQSHWSTLAQKPYIVSTGYAPNTTLSQAKVLYLQEESGLHLKIPTSKVYFLLNTKENHQLVQAYPELYFTFKHQIVKIVGEHKLSIWKKAMS